MEPNYALSLKVGGFVLVGLILASAMIFGVNNWRSLQPGYEIDLIFKSASGMMLGAPVKLSGVDVGEVMSLSVVRSSDDIGSTVRVRIWLPESIALRADDEVWISILGALGEKYIEIIPGPAQGDLLTNGAELVGAGIVSELEFSQQIEGTLDGVGEVLTSTQELLNINEIPDRIISALEEAEELSAKLQETAVRADSLLEEAQVLVESGNRAALETTATLEKLQGWLPLIAISMISIPVIYLLIVLVL